MCLLLGKASTSFRKIQLCIHFCVPFILVIFECVGNITGKEMSALGKANTDTGFHIYQELLKAQPEDNIFFSPFSIYAAMGLTYLAADGQTKSQMTTVLHLQTLGNNVHEAFKTLLPTLASKSDTTTLKIANKLYPNMKVAIPEKYVKDSLKFYQTALEGVDFSDEKTAREIINNWVSSQTDGKIKDLIPAGVLDALVCVVIVNAIYFKGQWQTMFDISRTSQELFRSPFQADAKTDMMKIERKFPYMKNPKEGFSALQLPYKDNDFSLIVVLPDAVDGLPTLERKLSSDWLKDIVKNMDEMKVNVKLPKFKMASRFELSNVFKSLGMVDIFSEEKADLSGIDPDKMTYLSHIFHQAAVEVNEEGTVAVAATAAVAKTRCLVIVQQFHADHPFLYFIYSRKFDSVLFMGRYVTCKDSIKSGKEEL